MLWNGGVIVAFDTPRKILVVEDEPILRMLAVETLEDAGWTVVEFATADDAASFWPSHGSDIGAVFTDINTPGRMDGLDLAFLVARTAPHAILIVTSGRYRTLPDGMPFNVRFLPKPWREEELLGALAEMHPGDASLGLAH